MVGVGLARPRANNCTERVYEGEKIPMAPNQPDEIFEQAWACFLFTEYFSLQPELTPWAPSQPHIFFEQAHQSFFY